jgi:cytochrome c-type biogenesis protein
VPPLAAIQFGAVGLATAFAAGFASFASPCVWPLVPAYLSYISGVAFQDLAEQSRRVTLATVGFVLGFGTVFTLVGLGAGVLGRQFLGNRRPLEIVAGAVVIAMGLLLIASARSGVLSRERRLHLARRPTGPLGAYVAGLAFAVGWTPCIGPTLTAIVALASQSGGALDGAVLLAAYSLGLGVPFLLAGMFFSRIAGSVAFLRRHAVALQQVAGTLLVLGGVLLASGQLTSLTARLTRYG